MKKILAFLFVLVSIAGAATSALYLHHERSTQATTEADCQNREVCLDKANLAPLGRFNDGTLFHVVTQEKPNVQFSGIVGVTGAATLSNTLTMSAISANRVPFTTTGGLFTQSANLTYDGTTLATNNGTYSGTLGITGVTTMGNNLNINAGQLTVAGNTARLLTINTVNSTPGVTSGLLFKKARGTVGAETDVANNDNLAFIYSQGYSGSYFNLAEIDFNVDAAVVSGQRPASRIDFYTNANNASPVKQMTIDRNGAVSLTGSLSVGGALVSSAGGGYESNTFTFAISGFSACNVGSLSGGSCGSVTARYTRVGNSVTIAFAQVYGTSNTTDMFITGIPASLIPSSGTAQYVPISEVVDNGTAYIGSVVVSNSSSWSVLPKKTITQALVSGVFTNSGSKGFNNCPITFSYTLQ